MTGCGDDEGPLGLLLAVDVIDEWSRRLSLEGSLMSVSSERNFTFEVQVELLEASYRDDIDTCDEAGLVDLILWEVEGVKTTLLGDFRDRHRTFDRSHRAIEGKLTRKDGASELFLFDLTTDAQNSEGNRQIIVSAVFGEFSRGEIDRNALFWEVEK
mgnify:CR=1 FL=1